MHTTLTAQQAKQARTDAQLSQAKVAQDLNLNRSYLSQFESGKYVFDDATLEALRDYYIEQGLESLATTQPESDNINQAIRLKDGFMLPDALPDDEAEELMTEYTDNRNEIKRLFSKPVKRGFFGIDPDKVEQQLNRAQYLMAQNYLIIEQLHGHDIVPLPKTGDQQKDKIGDYWHEQNTE